MIEDFIIGISSMIGTFLKRTKIILAISFARLNKGLVNLSDKHSLLVRVYPYNRLADFDGDYHACLRTKQALFHCVAGPLRYSFTQKPYKLDLKHF